LFKKGSEVKMKVYNTTIEKMNEALKMVNQKYDNNIIWNRKPENTSGNCIQFTLRVKDSKKSGARRSHSGRRLPSACWHVHGDFFDSLIEIESEARIVTGGKITITKDGGNWQDWNAGSAFNPVSMSELCEC
jgi:hypothetical protein